MRLILEGEDRLSQNKEKNDSKHCVSYSAEAEDWAVLTDERADMDRLVIDKEYIRELLNLVDDKVAYAIEKFYGDEMEQQEIADHLQMKRKTVSKMIRTNVLKIRKAVGVDSEEFVSKRNK